MESNNINFDDNNWPKKVLEVLSTETDLWIDIWMDEDEGDLYVDSLQISHGAYNSLRLLCWIKINQTISDKNILEFCNQQKYSFPRVCLNDVTEAVKRSICLDFMIPTDGGVSAEALQKIVELFWLDMIRIESKVSEIGWLEE